MNLCVFVEIQVFFIISVNWNPMSELEVYIIEDGR